MKLTHGRGHGLGAVLAIGGLTAGLAAAAVAGTPASAAIRRPPLAATEITTATTAFGTALVVGSGRYAGYSLYFITSDHGSSFGCPATPVRTAVGTLLCTGPSGSRQAEWPAMTTSGRPVAGAGVAQGALGTVLRPHVGRQITYDGHPLYLFDSGPGQVTGEGWDEPGLPPWHGVWNLMAPDGRALPWAGMLTSIRLKGRRVLAVPMLTGIGWLDFPVYSYSNDEPGSSACTGACARAWPPVLTSGMPGIGSPAVQGDVETLSGVDGLQVSYSGQPLYLDAGEGIVRSGSGYAATGSGAGQSYDGGTFSLVSP